MKPDLMAFRPAGADTRDPCPQLGASEHAKLIGCTASLVCTGCFARAHHLVGVLPCFPEPFSSPAGRVGDSFTELLNSMTGYFSIRLGEAQSGGGGGPRIESCQIVGGTSLFPERRSGSELGTIPLVLEQQSTRLVRLWWHTSTSGQHWKETGLK
jgi:hypothetical protein